MNYKNLLITLGFSPKENVCDVFTKKYPQVDNYCLEVDFEKQTIAYGEKIKFDNSATQNFSQPENFVVLECINRLLEKGYKPKNIILEKTWNAGHGTSGRLDICVTRDDGSEYLLIECKTYGKEFGREFARMKKDGGQLFTYFKFSNKADVIMLYASELKSNEIIYRNEIIKIEDDYRTGDVKDFYEKWNKLTKDNGVFENWVKPYNFESKALTINELENIKPEDSSFIFNRFLEILRHNVVSDKPNAFNKIFTLFLCKIYDEKENEGTDNELGFQWKEGVDDDVSFQLRLTDLYKKGMYEFLEKKITDISDDEFDKKYQSLFFGNDDLSKELKIEISKLRLEKNNEFAIKEVYDRISFEENAKVVKEIVELLQNYKIRYTQKQQYLSDFFELLLTTGLKQESGQFFTPVPIAQFIIKSLPIDHFVKVKLQEGKRDELLPYVIDYAAGSGHFVTEIMHEIQRQLSSIDTKNLKTEARSFVDVWRIRHFDWALQYVYGIEKDYRLVKVGKVGCYLHGDGLANVVHGDGLASFNRLDYKGKLKIIDNNFPKENKQFEIVISNPPYSVSSFKNAARNYYTEKDFELYNNLTDNSSEIECLFVERTKQLLKDGGMAGIILPSSILSNEGIYTKTREIILKYFEIVAITEFGSNTFMATGTNTVVLFLRRRNNYDCINLQKAVERFFDDFQDVTRNGIEKPVSKYINHVWENIGFEDYVSLLKKEPNSAIVNHEIYKEYRKKIKAKTEKDFWNVLIETEKEKLLYFILSYPQKVVLLKTGDKEDEKRFLGYEFSNRRGSEGIHPIQRGKTIDECTKLFDDSIFDNQEKASTYIYKAFSNDYEFPIHESLKNNISRVRLVDMLTFDRAGFAKNVSTSTTKKVKIESKWDSVRLGDVLYENDKSNIKVGTAKDLKEGEYPFFTSGESIFKFNNYLVDNQNIYLSTGGNAIVKFYDGKAAYSTDTFVIKSINEEEIKTKFIFYYLESIISIINESYFKGVGLKHLQKPDFRNIQMPFPSKEIQEKIVSEIDVLEKKEEEAKAEVESLKNLISEIVEKIKGVNTKLYNITTKIGSGATPLGGEGVYKASGITFIRSQNVYDGFFIENGLAYIDEEQAKKLEGVTVEKNDVLFNITGASIARCCVVEDKYLPARVNQHVSIIRTNQNALPQYVQLILASKEYKNQLLQIGEGATSRQAITKSQLEDFEIPLPPLAEQQKIVAEIETIEAKITELNQQLSRIPQEKEAVLKKYL